MESTTTAPMLRWLVVGVGDITTKRVIPAILQGRRSSLSGIVTRDTDKASPYEVPAYGTLQDALTAGGFDAVYVASPVFLHASQTIQSLRAGMHVLCEKPMAMSYPEAYTMIEAARASGKQLGVAYYRRTYPKVLRAIQLIEQGMIGQPVFAFASCHSWFAPGGGKREWLFDPAMAGGGPLYDVGSHRIDLLNYFFGEPRTVKAVLSNAVQPIAVEDSASVTIRYATGLHALLDVRWNSRITRDEFRIVGTEGELELTPLNEPRLVSPAGEERLPNHANLHYPCVENFVDAVIEGTPLLSSGATALWTDWVTQEAMTMARPMLTVSG